MPNQPIMPRLLQTSRYRVRRSAEYVRELWARRDFAWYLAIGNLKARNASTTLGLFWWVLNPLLLGMVYFLVFGILFGGRRGEGFLEYLLSGMFAFHFTRQTVVGGANSILNNAKLLVNINMPRLILPTAHLLEAAVGFLVSLSVFYVLVIPLSGVVPGPTFALLIVPLALQIVFNLGLGALAARLAVPFRDIKNLIPYLTRIWLYLSPVIWPLELLDQAGPKLQAIIHINPMWSLLGLYRTALLGHPFQWSHVWVTLAWAVGTAFLGVAVFVKYENRFARHL